METFDGKQLVLRPGLASNSFLTKLRAFRQSDTFTDVTLELISDEIDISYEDDGGSQTPTTNVTHIRAHKLLLAAISPYFEAMFTTGFSEANKDTVQIKGSFDHQCFVTMIDFFYSGQLNITTVNSVGLLEVADLLLLEATRRSLINYLQQTLNCDNCVWYRTVGQTYNSSNLVDAAESFINRNFDDVSSSADFCRLSASDVIYFISSKENPLHVRSETNLLKSLLIWSTSAVNSEHGVSEDCIDQIVQNVCWSNVSHQDLEAMRSDYVNGEEPNSLTKALLDSSNLLHTNSSTVQRIIGCHQWILAVGFDSRTVEYLDVSNQNRGWTKLTEIPGKRFRYGMSGAGLATDGSGVVFVSGGVGGKGGGILNAVDETLTFHVKKNRWEKLKAPMRQARKSHGCAWMGKSLYVVGGIDSQVGVTTVDWDALINHTAESLDCEWGVTTVPISSSGTATADDSINNNVDEGSSWQPIPAPTFLHNSAGTSLVNVGGKLVAISTYGTLENDCVYDVSVNSWTSLPAGRIERDRPGVGHHQGKLIIAGGWLDGYPVAGPRSDDHGVRALSNVVESLDIESGVWTQMPPLNIHREAPAVVSADGKIWVIGGKTFHDKEDRGTVEVFDGNEWRVLDQRLNQNIDQECSAVALIQP